MTGSLVMAGVARAKMTGSLVMAEVARAKMTVLSSDRGWRGPG
jgi:hypothetical protein